MRVKKQIDEGLKHRDDLIRSMDAAATFLASRDKDPDSQAEAVWRLCSNPDGSVWIGVNVRDQDFEVYQQYLADLLAAPGDRELRLVHLWNKVLRARTRREIDRGNELISQYQGE